HQAGGGRLMAFDLRRYAPLPGVAASAINVGQSVQLDVGDVQRQFLPVATNNVEPIGVAEASAAAADPVTVADDGHVKKVVAAASIGQGADVGVASTNGNYGPIS